MIERNVDLVSLSDPPGEGELQKVVGGVLSLEVQLWVEVALLIGFGIVMIYSASSVMALRKYSDASYYIKKQLIWVPLGIATMTIISRFPYKKYTDWAQWLLLLAVAALAAVLVPGIGTEINNARRWFNLGYFLAQPAEYAKVVWIVYLSVSVAKKQKTIKQFTVGFLPHMLLLGLISVLLLKEPDFGTTLMLGCLTISLLLLGGVPYLQLSMLIPVAVIFFYKFVYLVPYRWERVTAFLNPWTDPLDSGYQLIQAWIAVGSGGLAGKGLGLGQQKLFYLPESFTDFILAVIGEELGFLGIMVVIGLFFLLYQTGMKVSRSAPDLLGGLMAFGLTLLLSLQAVLNIGVVLGLFPTKGMPLPFISYGGSAFVANCAAVGVLMNIARSSSKQV